MDLRIGRDHVRERLTLPIYTGQPRSHADERARRQRPPHGPVTFIFVAERDRFFEGNPWYLLGLLAMIIAAVARGQVWVVVVSLAIAGVVIGVWYPIWRWRKNSRLREAGPTK